MFKKIIVLLSLLLLTSCSAPTLSTESVSAAYQKNFTCKMTAAYAGDETAADVERNGLSITFDVTSPEELAGLSMETADGKIKVSFEGLETELNFSELPESGPLKLFCGLVETLSLPDEFSLSQNGNELIILGKNFSARLDPESLGLLSAEFPEEETEFIFTDWAFSDQ